MDRIFLPSTRTPPRVGSHVTRLCPASFDAPRRHWSRYCNGLPPVAGAAALSPTLSSEAADPRPIPVMATSALVAALALNWFLATSLASPLFSYTSLLLFGALILLVGRVSSAGLILLLPLVITRGATLMSLLVIEAGAYMPEVNRLGEPGDASASFV